MRIFQGWLTLFGLVVAGIGLAHLFFGQVTYIGGGSVNATMESDLRFFNLLFVAYGLAFVWAARDIAGRAALIDLLGLLFFVGGLARLLAWAEAGTPSWFYVLMIPVELIIPIVNFVWLRSERRRIELPARPTTVG
ncbi:DUF4345 domain-containing protein [Jongsikchunia kroppenstedtii]|uniref:DUF4345 domain-containing protein n=1 Tax=Jongsikchunia kroppenstedtii TaxID=1121721 RepID=UPI00039F7455|nr:DUF4345 domain-containing protein [Jongsikchunia kroppenstedtii]